MIELLQGLKEEFEKCAREVHEYRHDLVNASISLSLCLGQAAKLIDEFLVEQGACAPAHIKEQEAEGHDRGKVNDEPVTAKQLRVIGYIAQNTGAKFVGKTKQDALEFISKWMGDSVAAYRGGVYDEEMSETDAALMNFRITDDGLFR